MPAQASGVVVEDTGLRYSALSNTMVQVAPARYHTDDASGVAVYRGRDRIAPREGLVLLESSEALRRYDAALDRVHVGAYRRWARPAWIGLLAIGGTLLTVGLVEVLQVKPDPATGKSELGTPIALLGGSIAALLGSLPFLGLDLLHQSEAIEYDARSEIVVEGQSDRDLELAVRRYNAARARECGCTP